MRGTRAATRIGGHVVAESLLEILVHCTAN